MEQLKKTLTPILLWGLGVGYVISGMYFGWNLGLQQGGSLGMALATGLVVVMYVCFTLCYAELACAIPKAGGVYDYARLAFGRNVGFVAGMAQVIEFVFAPPAIAMGIGAYVSIFLPQFSDKSIAIVAYVVFTLLNILGVKLAATFELFVTIVAIVGLLIFASVALPHVSMANLQKQAFVNGYQGIAAAIPFAIWFFLGIEGMANAAEESINPQRDLTRSFGLAMLTLVALCVLTFVGAVGINGWESIVYDTLGQTSDSPLPLALFKVTPPTSWVYRSIVVFGIFGLIASFHGLLMAAGRATFEMGRTAHFPEILGQVHSKYQTPAIALIANMLIGIVFLLVTSTADIIIFSVLGALVLYTMAIASMLKLRHSTPQLNRPFVAPLFPLLPYVGLVLTAGAFVAVINTSRQIGANFVIILIVAYLRSFVTKIKIKVKD
jgi:ethanolamine permease